MTAAANAHSGADAVHEYAVKCMDAPMDAPSFDNNAAYPSAPTADSCRVRGSTNNAAGADRDGVIIYGWADAFDGILPAAPGDHYVIINRSADAVAYEGGAGSRLYLQPRTTNSPTLFLRDLTGGTATVPAGRQRLVTFEGIDVDRDALYWSEPQALPTCGTGAEETPAGCRCQSGYQNLTGDDTQTCEMIPPPDDDNGGGNNNDNPGQRTSTPPQRGDHDYVPAIAGGVGILLLAGWQILTDGGDIDDFSFSPDFGYAITESGYSYKYGGRLDFRKDAWSLYWTAGQRNSDGDWGDFRYKSGGEYDGGFWRAAFSESVAGDITDYDFSLSADWRGGIWNVSPEFFADGRYANGEFAMTNSFRISGELRFDDWRLSASGNAERVRLSAVRRF